uniref:Uncharacterized protein n=1 Tax=Setaria italica TaxID=4555 RepID=K3Y474_SETIT
MHIINELSSAQSLFMFGLFFGKKKKFHGICICC